MNRPRRRRGGGARRRGGTVAGLNETLLRGLFATPPPDFVAARNEVVKALRKDKARDDATAVAALRRPGWDDWSLNTVATSDPDVVAGFVDAAAQVRDAQRRRSRAATARHPHRAARPARPQRRLVRLADPHSSAPASGRGRRDQRPVVAGRGQRCRRRPADAGILGSGDAAPKSCSPTCNRRRRARSRQRRPRSQADQGDEAKARQRHRDADDRDEAVGGRGAGGPRRGGPPQGGPRRGQPRSTWRRSRPAIAPRPRGTRPRRAERAQAALAEAEAATPTAQRELDEAVAAEEAASAAVDDAAPLAEGGPAVASGGDDVHRRGPHVQPVRSGVPGRPVPVLRAGCASSIRSTCRRSASSC